MRRLRLSVAAACLLIASGQAGAMPPRELANAAQLVYSSACVAAALDADGAGLYRASSLPDGVTGSLKRYEVSIDSAGRLGAADQPQWDASALLDATPSAARRIYTTRRDDAGMRTIPFLWEALGETERALLDITASGEQDGLGALRLAYLRGMREAESPRQGGMRDRLGLLGATLAGVPRVAGRGAHAAIYLAANDGMLHAFDSASGAELFAYLPRAIAPWWSRLTTPSYRNAPYVEGAIAVGEAKARGKRITVLAVGMGGAAKGVYALDVSDPVHFGDKGGVMFEFTEQDDADIGHVYGAPQIVRARIGAAPAADYLVVGGGYNTGGRGRIALFLLSLDKDPADPWRRNANYFKWFAPADDAVANGLGPASLTVDDAGDVRYAYAGDMRGNLWRFDLADTSETAPRRPVFIAADAGGQPQPITVAPRIAQASDGVLLLFGTGSLLFAGDGADRSRQTLYGVRDHGMTTEGATRAQLAERLLAIDGSYRIASVTANDGWYLDFPEAGERSAWGIALEGSALVAASMIPRGAPCSADLRLYWLDALSGKPAPGISAPPLLPAEAIGRAPMVRQRDEVAPADGRGQRRVVSRRRLVGAGRPSAMPTQDTASSAPGRTGRLGWREVVDVEALRDAARR
ncbi:pilus assembly protein [Noviherbaspirillum pedocola]|uniref:PilY1 beta-propeller domain-containing protein n=1 Tax=Noviherbaspirillum pedocola TaxID=2801341 RepID=A0A934W015_9BURK|nr:PilC/PilY family type IV pilus protein [Noviherbaspirillum pedocola]MBK4733601.1 hypothetical protein [Noviherbaspirillum pedocola]